MSLLTPYLKRTIVSIKMPNLYNKKDNNEILEKQQDLDMSPLLRIKREQANFRSRRTNKSEIRVKSKSIFENEKLKQKFVQQNEYISTICLSEMGTAANESRVYSKMHIRVKQRPNVVSKSPFLRRFI